MTDTKFRLRLIWRALLHKKAKALLIILAVAMGSSVVTALLNLEFDLRSRMNRELRDYGPNVVLIPDPRSDQRFLAPSALKVLKDRQVASVVLAYSPQLFVSAEIDGAPVIVTGAELQSIRKLYPGWAWNPDSISEGDAFAGSNLAERLKLVPGKTVMVTAQGKSIPVRIAGTIESGEAEDDQLFVPLRLAQQLVGIGNRFQSVLISALGDASDVENRFSQSLKPEDAVQFKLIRKIAVAEEIILDRISNLMSLVIGIIFVILFFCIHTTVSAILLGRQSEIALLRILGARRKQIMGGLTLELLVLALIGGFVGFCCGILMAQVLGKVLFQTFVEPHARIFWITILSSATMMILSSFLPILRVINRQAAAVLKEA